MLKIYFNNQPLYIVSEISLEAKEEMKEKKIVSFSELYQVPEMLETMRQQGVDAGFFIHNSPQEVLEEVKKQTLVVQAAGGLVYTKEEEFLLIFRRGKWDLPKGKLDEGEDLETCAVREVEEETGAKHLKLEAPLCITYHTYTESGDFILKESHWYLMSVPQKQILKPQTEEDIQKCEWVETKNLPAYVENAHRLIIDVIEDGIEKLKKKKNI